MRKLLLFILLVNVVGVNFGAPADPTEEPTKPATDAPTEKPTDEPTEEPTQEPKDPTQEPTEPTQEPKDPTQEPKDPTQEPTEPTQEPTEAPAVTEKTSVKPVIAVGVDTSEKLTKWGEAAKDAVKKPSEIVKDSVNIMKDKVKLGTEFGEAALSKGIADLGKQGVATVTDLGKMGLNMTTNIANKTLGLIHKIGDMMPVGGKIVKGGVSLGRKGLTAAKALGENLLDNILWLAESGFGWLKSTASTSKHFIHNKTDTLVTSLHQGIDNGAGKIGDFIAAGIKKLPIFKVNASLSVG